MVTIRNEAVEQFNIEPIINIFARVENQNFVTHAAVNNVIVSFHNKLRFYGAYAATLAGGGCGGLYSVVYAVQN